MVRHPPSTPATGPTARRLLRSSLRAALALAALGAPPQAAGEPPPARALLRSGAALGVSGAEYRDGWTFLRLAEGGEIGIPADRVLRVEEIPNSRAPRAEEPPAPPQPPAAARDPGAAATPAGSVAPGSGSAAGAPASDLLPLIARAAALHALDPQLLAALVRAESNFEPRAVSRVGAQGLLQLMPETSRSLGVTDPFDPWQNLEAGARYFRALLDRFGGDIVLALAAYNAGEEAVERYGGLPPFGETRLYVDRVITHFGRGF